LRETAVGGIAGTKSAQEIVEKIREKWDNKN